MRHELDRAAVRELECALCGLRQAAGLACAGCGVAFGAYACLRCRFFDDDLRKQQFHCDACGICRVGGRANFFHCATCGCCYAATLEARSRRSHRARHVGPPCASSALAGVPGCQAPCSEVLRFMVR